MINAVEVEISRSAKNDLRRGFRFYEKSRFGIGSYFVKTLISEMQVLAVTAGIHSKKGILFRVKSKKFPHWIYYFIKENVVYVRAILDARQEPLKIQRREQREEKFL